MDVQPFQTREVKHDSSLKKTFESIPKTQENQAKKPSVTDKFKAKNISQSHENIKACVHKVKTVFPSHIANKFSTQATTEKAKKSTATRSPSSKQDKKTENIAKIAPSHVNPLQQTMNKLSSLLKSIVKKDTESKKLVNKFNDLTSSLAAGNSSIDLTKELALLNKELKEISDKNEVLSVLTAASKSGSFKALKNEKFLTYFTQKYEEAKYSVFMTKMIDQGLLSSSGDLDASIRGLTALSKLSIFSEHSSSLQNIMGKLREFNNLRRDPNVMDKLKLSKNKDLLKKANHFISHNLVEVKKHLLELTKIKKQTINYGKTSISQIKNPSIQQEFLKRFKNLLEAKEFDWDLWVLLMTDIDLTLGGEKLVAFMQKKDITHQSIENFIESLSNKQVGIHGDKQLRQILNYLDTETYLKAIHFFEEHLPKEKALSFVKGFGQDLQNAIESNWGRLTTGDYPLQNYHNRTLVNGYLKGANNLVELVQASHQQPLSKEEKSVVSGYKDLLNDFLTTTSEALQFNKGDQSLKELYRSVLIKKQNENVQKAILKEDAALSEEQRKELQELKLKLSDFKNRSNSLLKEHERFREQWKVSNPTFNLNIARLHKDIELIDTSVAELLALPSRR